MIELINFIPTIYASEVGRWIGIIVGIIIGYLLFAYLLTKMPILCIINIVGGLLALITIGHLLGDYSLNDVGNDVWSFTCLISTFLVIMSFGCEIVFQVDEGYALKGSKSFWTDEWSFEIVEDNKYGFFGMFFGSIIAPIVVLFISGIIIFWIAIIFLGAFVLGAISLFFRD